MSNFNPPTDADLEDDNGVSKSERKREAERLQKIGKRICALNPDQVTGLDLSPALLTAINDYNRFPSHGAKRRQLQYIGKLMRKADTAHIEAGLAKLDGESAEARYHFHQLEVWRDDLLANADAITRFITAYPDVDRQQLRQLVKKNQQAKNTEQQKTTAKALFRFIRDTTESHSA